MESRYNSLRFRDAEFAPKRPGVRRVMVLGDSFTEGQGVKEPDTYVRVLEARLRSGGGEWEVRNCGRRGADFPLLFELFEQVLRFEPDVVVYGMVLNDADQSEEFRSRQTYVNDWILDRGATADGRPLPDLGRFDSRLVGFVRDRLETRRTTRETTRWYLDMYATPNREGWARTQGYLKEMNRRLRERGARFLVASWPLIVNMEGEDPFEAATTTVSRFCVTAGIAWHDLRPALRRRPTSSLWVHPVDMHPNELAHASPPRAWPRSSATWDQRPLEPGRTLRHDVSSRSTVTARPTSGGRGPMAGAQAMPEMSTPENEELVSRAYTQALRIAMTAGRSPKHDRLHGLSTSRCSPRRSGQRRVLVEQWKLRGGPPSKRWLRGGGPGLESLALSDRYARIVRRAIGVAFPEGVPATDEEKSDRSAAVDRGARGAPLATAANPTSRSSTGRSQSMSWRAFYRKAKPSA